MRFRQTYQNNKFRYGWQKLLKYLRLKIKAKGKVMVARKLARSAEG